MTVRKRKSLDAALRALFEQRAESPGCGPLVALAEQLAAQVHGFGPAKP